MPYRPQTSTTPPIPGQSKRLYSPDLFDVNTGAYPKAAPPLNVRYFADGAGVVPFFEQASPWGTIQASFSAPNASTVGVHPITDTSYTVGAISVAITSDAAGTQPILGVDGNPLVIALGGASSGGPSTASIAVPDGVCYLWPPATVGGSIEVFKSYDDGSETFTNTAWTFSVGPRPLQVTVPPSGVVAAAFAAT
jgi:hypothetical protein